MGQPRVVIIGAGFGGLACAKKLAGQPVDVLLLDANNYHLFTPLLYQVASSLLNPSDIARPVRSIFGGTQNVRFRQAHVTGIDFDRKRVRTAKGIDVDYDYLVVAAGSTTNFFGIEGVEERALGLKDLSEALELRNHILRCLEAASLMTPEEAEPWLTFVVVGGGPTGVEYAGALSELIHGVLPDEYPELAGHPIRVVLVEALPQVLPPFPEDLGREAHTKLERRGITVLTGLRVSAVTPEEVELSDGSTIRSHTLVWAAGVRPNDLAGAIDVSRSRSGRVEVDAYLRVPSVPGVFAIGDIASFVQDGKEVPMLSAPAMQEGRSVAENILRSIAGLPLKPFHYRDKGSMATIGKNAAVAQLGPLHLKGFIGWVTWLIVHLYYIIGFRNRLAVLLGWGWNYVRSDRPVRIITRARERGAGPPAGRPLVTARGQGRGRGAEP
ncbi:MAG: NAD(P)/FAD-dependent oxidoreductase [Dehalococcoidia bacterium]|nr:NAD(P)/FAD-dependent oxidoreductase [Dehalococcoidia bacterium]